MRLLVFFEQLGPSPNHASGVQRDHTFRVRKVVDIVFSFVGFFCVGFGSLAAATRGGARRGRGPLSAGRGLLSLRGNRANDLAALHRTFSVTLSFSLSAALLEEQGFDILLEVEGELLWDGLAGPRPVGFHLAL